MADTWLTIEQAAVTLGLSVRTVNRHINAGKIQSRLADGRREVLVRIPDEAEEVATDSETNTTAKSAGASARGAGGSHQASAYETASPSAADDSNGNGYGRTSRASASAVPHQGGQTSYDAPSQQMETMLALADNAADKAEMAVLAYQTLARTAENHTTSLRRYATTAWWIVAVLVVGVLVAVGWTTHHLTRAEIENSTFKREAELAALAAQRASAERDKARSELSDAKQEAARIEGRMSVMEKVEDAAARAAELVASRVTAARPDKADVGERSDKPEVQDRTDRLPAAPSTAPTTLPTTAPAVASPAGSQAARPSPPSGVHPSAGPSGGSGQSPIYSPATRPVSPPIRRDRAVPSHFREGP